METESPIRLLEGTDRWSNLKQSSRYAPSSAKMAIEGLGLFLKDQRFQGLEKDAIPSRSESAPPSMEGSIEAIENIFSHQKPALDPGSIYPSIFAVNSQSELQLHAVSSYDGTGDAKLNKRNSLPPHDEESEDDQSSERSASVSTQESSSHALLPIHDHDRALSHRSKADRVVSDADKTNAPCSDNISAAGAGDVHGAIAAVKRVNLASPSNPESRRFHKKEKPILQNIVLPQQANSSRVPGGYSHISYPGISHASGSLNQFHYGSSNVTTAGIQSSGLTPPLYANAAAFMTSPTFYPNLQPVGFFSPQYNTAGYSFNSAVSPSYLAGYPHQGAVPLAFGGGSFPTSGGNSHAYGQVGVPWQFPFHMQYFQLPVRDSYGSSSHGDGAVANQVNSGDSGKGVQLGGLSTNFKSQNVPGAGYTNLNLQRVDMPSTYYFGSPTNDGHLGQFPAATVVSPVAQSKPSAGRGYNTSLSPFSSKANGQSQNWNDINSYCFLEELKTGKGQRFDLSDIAGHIVEFSIDQHGSRFIQQKLETCSVEEKASVFKEVVPHASKLITDVFGNYVIQKLFEYGSPEQRKYLANQLEGEILALSLQMYGCRVIQKALEVIDLEQKSRLIRELDGHVIRCVRDQNGNHVIQKCIESIPTDNIHFIISSFRGQVPSLSIHPYGCRVIQRILEHCNNDTQTQFIVDEILESVCSLAQDQYGNYVTQHVLERGKACERIKIIEKLGGSIVQLSQHKFASNVVEKCLEYSDCSARGMLIKEIIGDGDKSDNLLVMMKDQYANYVIQKILEKCCSDERELLLGLIRNHITALKKYTYGKHIVARFELLFGEEMEAASGP